MPLISGKTITVAHEGKQYHLSDFRPSGLDSSFEKMIPGSERTEMTIAGFSNMDYL